MNNNPGDVNHDGEASIADINALLKAILDDEFNSDIDVNNDGELDIADINALTNLILSSPTNPPTQL